METVAVTREEWEYEQQCLHHPQDLGVYATDEPYPGDEERAHVWKQAHDDTQARLKRAEARVAALEAALSESCFCRWFPSGSCLDGDHWPALEARGLTEGCETCETKRRLLGAVSSATRK